MLLYSLKHLTSLGALPDQALGSLDSDILYCEEQIYGSITFRNFRSPHRMSSWKRQWYLGSVILSEDRLQVFRWSNRLVNVPILDPRFEAMRITIEASNIVAITHAAELFQPQWSGTIEHRLQLNDPAHFRQMLASQCKHLNVSSD